MVALVMRTPYNLLKSALFLMGEATLTKHQICLASSQAFYEGFSRAFRDPDLSGIEADLTGIRFLFPWQLTLSACLKRLCEGRIDLTFSWNKARASQNEIAAYAAQVGLFDKPETIEADPYFNAENYCALYSIDKTHDPFIVDRLQVLLKRVPEFARPLASALSELADNIVQHSGRTEDEGWGFVQAQATGSRFRIAFCDFGVGHYKTYQRSHSLNGRGPLEVLETSLKGHGLTRVCEVIDAHKGVMEIYSDGLRCRYSQGKKVTKVLGFRTKGTLISIEIPVRS